MQESAKLYSRRFESGLALYMSVAQLVEHRSPKPAVGGSIPSRHASPGGYMTEQEQEQEVWIYESPDGGKTVYRRKFGEQDMTKRELVTQ